MRAGRSDSRESRELFPSKNELGIPDLLPHKGEIEGFLRTPLSAWGSVARTSRLTGTTHFYVDDYRFEALWTNPEKLVDTGLAAMVEPNFSVLDATPPVEALWQTYRKRWISRWAQNHGIRVYVDLYVCREFASDNLIGVPQGYPYYATRGRSLDLDGLDFELSLAERHAGGLDAPVLVYGGGLAVQGFLSCHKVPTIYVRGRSRSA